jgi:hypothetical protein
MDKEVEEFYHDATNYIIERATAEGSIPNYFKQNQDIETDMHDSIFKIIYLSDEYDEPTGDNSEVFDYSDKNAYIAEKTGVVSADIIELVLWFKICHMMSYDGITILTECPSCGCGEIYEKESKEGILFESCFICGRCGRELSFEEVCDDTNIIDMDERLPLQTYKEPDPMEGLNPDGLPVFTDKDAVYRFRVSRRIIELDGEDTLADLSRAIQYMYDLSNERMSSFYMGKKYLEERREISCPRNIPFGDITPSTAENYEFYRLGLYENQKFLYLHDFIRENRFPITFLGTR